MFRIWQIHQISTSRVGLVEIRSAADQWHQIVRLHHEICTVNRYWIFGISLLTSTDRYLQETQVCIFVGRILRGLLQTALTYFGLRLLNGKRHICMFGFGYFPPWSHHQHIVSDYGSLKKRIANIRRAREGLSEPFTALELHSISSSDPDNISRPQVPTPPSTHNIPVTCGLSLNEESGLGTQARRPQISLGPNPQLIPSRHDNDPRKRGWTKQRRYI